jgi:hypothetical protein
LILPGVAGVLAVLADEGNDEAPLLDRARVRVASATAAIQKT